MKRIFKLIIAAIGFTLLMVTCTKNKDLVFATFTSRVDLTGSTLVNDQASTALLLSTDGGTTYQNFANITAGQKYMVQILDRNLGHNLKANDFYAFDWSASNPKPTDATSDSPEFTMSSGDNKLLVTVLDAHCAFVPSGFTGTWSSKEVPVPGGCNCSSTEPQHIIQDSANPNKLIMDNFFGDGVGNATVYMIFSVSTTAKDQIITVPEQTTQEGMKASGTGTYDQCRGKFTLHVHYDQYEWIYEFTRP
jgi:hypothetical protein